MACFDEVELECKKEAAFFKVLAADLLAMFTVYSYTAMALARLLATDNVKRPFLLSTARQSRRLLPLATPSK